MKFKSNKVRILIALITLVVVVIIIFFIQAISGSDSKEENEKPEKTRIEPKLEPVEKRKKIKANPIIEISSEESEVKIEND